MSINNCNYSPVLHKVILGDANGGITSLTPGVAGTILTSQDAGANSSFTTAGEAWVLLSTLTPSNVASVAFTSLISSTYKTYVVIFSHLKATVLSAALQMVISTNNGSTYSSTNYISGINYIYAAQTVFHNITSASSSYFTINSAGDITVDCSGMLWLYGFGVAALPQFACTSYVSQTLQYSSGINTTSGTYDAIKFLFTSANISSGTISLYGIKQ